MADQYHIRHISKTDDAYVLCDPDGNPVPSQTRTTLVSQANSLPVFVVEFEAGSTGLRVIDDREEM